jgi:peptide deformylase
VDGFDGALARLAEDMLETMYDAPGVGLAAPQIGRSIRLIVFDDHQGSGPRRLVNPTLSDFEGEQTGEEGCLSLPGLYFQVTRAMRVRAEGFDVDGTPVEIAGEGLLARILQHEVDHIDGMLFIDRLSEADRREALRLLREQELGLAPTPRKPSRAL